MSLWRYNDVELDIDMEDVEFQMKYEQAFERMAEEEKKLQTVGKASEFSGGYVAMFWHLFDGIFGEGTSEKLFNGKKNLGMVDDCYESFIELCQKDVLEINKRRSKRVAKYMPKK